MFVNPILEKIVNLRSRVKESRQELAKALNMDYEVIQSALMDRRETQLECKRYDAHTAHKELNEAVCVEQKRLNHFAHQKVVCHTIVNLNYECIGRYVTYRMFVHTIGSRIQKKKYVNCFL